jgi:hypothetical protein
MTGHERILATLQGRSTDHLALMPITMMFAADILVVIGRLLFSWQIAGKRIYRDGAPATAASARFTARNAMPIVYAAF